MRLTWMTDSLITGVNAAIGLLKEEVEKEGTASTNDINRALTDRQPPLVDGPGCVLEGGHEFADVAARQLG